MSSKLDYIRSLVKSNFVSNVYFLKSGLNTVLNKLSGKFYSNSRLKNASNRIVVPKPFEPFVKAVEKSLGITFPKNLEFSKKEVVDSDALIISQFSNANFNYGSLNLDILVEAAISSFIQMGLLDGNKTDFIDSQIAAESFESSTSSGFPFYKPKGDMHARKDAVDWCSEFVRKPQLSNILAQPTSVFHRFQYKVNVSKMGISKKIRPVWGVSYRVSTLEAVVFRNLVDKHVSAQIQDCVDYGHCHVATGLTNVGKSNVVKFFRRNCRKIYSMDVFQFDSYVASFMWALFYASLPFSININDHTKREVVKSLLAFHNYTPYCYGNTILKFQHKGVPSGSLITSLFDSWVSLTITNYAFLEKTGKDASFKCSVLGDDNLISGDYFSFDYFVNVYKRFGMIVSKEKSHSFSSNDNIQFLGVMWDHLNRPTEPIDWYIAHFCMPTRFFTNLPFPVSDMQTFRALTIAMPLYGGLDTFEKLIGNSDVVWQRLKSQFYLGQTEPQILAVSEDQRINLKLTIPLSLIMKRDWTMF